MVIQPTGEILTPWEPCPEADYSCIRKVLGTNPDVVENRRAFVNKTARIYVNGEWVQVHRGSGGSNARLEKTNGYDLESRRVADLHLVAAGYVLLPSQ